MEMKKMTHIRREGDDQVPDMPDAPMDMATLQVFL